MKDYALVSTASVNSRFPCFSCCADSLRDIRLCWAMCRWSFVSGKMNKQGAQEKMRQAGVLLFHNLFELEPRLRQLFPFKTGAGHIEDKVCHAIPGCPWVPNAVRPTYCGLWVQHLSLGRRLSYQSSGVGSCIFALVQWMVSVKQSKSHALISIMLCPGTDNVDPRKGP